MAQQKRSRKKRKTVWYVALVVLWVGVVWFGTFRGSVSRRLAKQISALETQGYPVTLDQLDAWYQLPDGAENGADAYMEAFAWSAKWNHDARRPLPILGSGSLPEPHVPFDPNTLALMQDYLKDNADTLNWLHKAAQIQHVRYPVDYREGTRAPTPWLQDVRHCAMLCAIQILVAIEQGQSDEFIGAVSDGMALSGSLRQMPTLVGQLVRVACMGLFRGGVMERGLARLELTDEQLIQLSNSLGSKSDVNYLVRASAGEACLVLNGIRDATLSSIFDEVGQPQGGSSWMIPYHVLGLSHRDLCEYLDLIEVTLNPRPSGAQAFLKAGQLAETRRQAIPKSHLILQIISPVVLRSSQIYARYYAGQISTRTAIAVLRYRLKYRQLPEDLAAMVPEYLAEVPADPFDGESIRYIKKDKVFIVYSVDEDGQDNGGRARDPNDRGKPFDLGFSVRTQD